SSGQSAAMLSVPPPSWLRRRGAAHERTRVALLEEPAMSSPTGNVAPIGGALTMAKTPKELEQIHEHNRKVLRELQFDSTKWLLVPRAIRALVPVFEPALQAAAELHKLMRSPSGAIPTATRWGRWRDGLQTSHIITRYPAPADWDAVSPESLIMDFREISEGDGNVVRCWDYIDLQYFNRWLSGRAEQAEKTRATEKSRKRARVPTPDPASRHAGGRPAEWNWGDAAQHVARSVARRGPLPRDDEGRPILADAFRLMREFFDGNEPPGPPDSSIYRWLRENPQTWWD